MAISDETLPTEVWSKILGYATDRDPASRDTSRLTNSMTPPIAPDSMRQKMTLSLVSKYFREIVAKFLYEGVKIWNTRQLQSLVLGRRSHKAQFERYTVFFKFHAVPLGMYRAQHFGEMSSSRDTLLLLSNVIAMCKNLQTFDFFWFCNRSEPTLASTMHRLVDALSPTLLCLVWHVGLDSDHLSDGVFHILLQKRSLRTLKIGQYMSMLGETREYLSTQQPLRAEQLVHLEIDNTMDGFFTVFQQQQWQTPCLTHMTAQACITVQPLIPVTHLDLTALHSTSFDWLVFGPEHFHQIFPNLRCLSYIVLTEANRSPWRVEWVTSYGITGPPTTIITITPPVAGDAQWENLAEHLRNALVHSPSTLRRLVILRFPAHMNIPDTRSIILKDVEEQFHLRGITLDLLS